MKNTTKEKFQQLIDRLLCPETLLFLLVLLAVGVLVFCDSSGLSLAMAVIPGVAGGKHVTEEPLTRALAQRESPELLLNEIDRRIVKIRPMATPIDQLSRWAGAKRSGSMVVDYYSVDTRPTSALTTTEFTGVDATGDKRFQRARLTVDNIDMFEVSETLLVRGVRGFEPDGVTPSSQDIVLYVVSKSTSENYLEAVSPNGKTVDGFTNCIPTIPTGTMLVRMGRAAGELDVQTAQFEALPVKCQNYCQIFKMQIEQSTFQKIANKEVEWDFSDAEEAAIYDMRLGMEKSFMFGVKNTIFDPRKKENVMLTGGIWWQAGNHYTYDPTKEMTQDDLIDMMRQAFTGNGGNKRKILIGGSVFIGLINKIEMTKVVMAREDKVKWGIDFSEISSKFGKLYVLYSEVFDDCGMHDYGFIFDPEFIQKWSHVPFGAQELDLKKAGVRNTDALVLTEASCLTLRYPAAHMRIEPLG